MSGPIFVVDDGSGRIERRYAYDSASGKASERLKREGIFNGSPVIDLKSDGGTLVLGERDQIYVNRDSSSGIGKLGNLKLVLQESAVGNDPEALKISGVTFNDKTHTVNFVLKVGKTEIIWNDTLSAGDYEKAKKGELEYIDGLAIAGPTRENGQKLDEPSILTSEKASILNASHLRKHLDAVDEKLKDQEVKNQNYSYANRGGVYNSVVDTRMNHATVLQSGSLSWLHEQYNKNTLERPEAGQFYMPNYEALIQDKSDPAKANWWRNVLTERLSGNATDISKTNDAPAPSSVDKNSLQFGATGLRYQATAGANPPPAANAPGAGTPTPTPSTGTPDTGTPGAGTPTYNYQAGRGVVDGNGKWIYNESYKTDFQKKLLDFAKAANNGVEPANASKLKDGLVGPVTDKYAEQALASSPELLKAYKQGGPEAVMNKPEFAELFKEGGKAMIAAREIADERQIAAKKRAEDAAKHENKTAKVEKKPEQPILSDKTKDAVAKIDLKHLLPEQASVSQEEIDASAKSLSAAKDIGAKLNLGSKIENAERLTVNTTGGAKTRSDNLQIG
jgi:hypothetical protein